LFQAGRMEENISEAKKGKINTGKGYFIEE
jgi:hypothetical protein